MVRPDREEMLQYWKSAVNREMSSKDYNLTEDSEWVKILATLENKLIELENASSESEIRVILRYIFRPSSKLIWASKPSIFLGFLKSSDFSSLDEYKIIILDVKSSGTYKNSWTDDIYNLLLKFNPDGTLKYKATKAFLKNIHGELYGKLHYESFPIMNSCSRRILKRMGYRFNEQNYESFNEAFDNFKHDYNEKIGKLSSENFPFNIELDQFCNFFDKNEDAKKYLKTDIHTNKGLPTPAAIIHAIKTLSEEGETIIRKEELMRKVASLLEANGSYLSVDWEDKIWEKIIDLANSIVK